MRDRGLVRSFGMSIPTYGRESALPPERHVCGDPEIISVVQQATYYGVRVKRSWISDH